jgi:hypothetical protein
MKLEREEFPFSIVLFLPQILNIFQCWGIEEEAEKHTFSKGNIVIFLQFEPFIFLS